MASLLYKLVDRRILNTLLHLYRLRMLRIGLIQFCLLGRNKVGVDLMHLTVKYKLYKRIKKQFYPIAERLITQNSYNPTERTKNKIIWICWWQGIEKAPSIVKRCNESVYKHFSDWDIRIITKANYSEYITIPEDIVDKWERGIISNTHMSDILRLELLIKFGGLWLDATIYCTNSQIPTSILNSTIFVYQTLRPGCDGKAVPLSNWLIYASKDNRALKLTRDLLYHQWRTSKRLPTYFMFHYLMMMAFEIFNDEYERMPKFCNSIPHILQYSLTKSFDQSYWNDLVKMSCFHKLTYKIDFEHATNCEGTYYDAIIKDGYEHTK